MKKFKITVERRPYKKNTYQVFNEIENEPSDCIATIHPKGIELLNMKESDTINITKEGDLTYVYVLPNTNNIVGF